MKFSSFFDRNVRITIGVGMVLLTAIIGFLFQHYNATQEKITELFYQNQLYIAKSRFPGYRKLYQGG